MENVERVQANAAPKIMLSAEQQEETKKLLDVVAEQAVTMSREETRDMLAFFRGMKFARAMDTAVM